MFAAAAIVPKTGSLLTPECWGTESKFFTTQGIGGNCMVRGMGFLSSAFWGVSTVVKMNQLCGFDLMPGACGSGNYGVGGEVDGGDLGVLDGWSMAKASAR